MSRPTPPRTTGLVDDDDPAVRNFAAFAMATALNVPPAANEALRNRLAVESDPAVVISLVLAIGQLAGNAVEVELWWCDPGRPDHLRFRGGRGAPRSRRR